MYSVTTESDFSRKGNSRGERDLIRVEQGGITVVIGEYLEGSLAARARDLWYVRLIVKEEGRVTAREDQDHSTIFSAINHFHELLPLISISEDSYGDATAPLRDN